jgi:MFS family permease
MGLVFAQLYGYLVTDRLPLFLCKRFGNNLWKPEYRLHALWIPSLILQPIGLGLFGASLKFHLHYMVLALASFLITLSAVISVPILDTYVVECFTTRSTEANSVMNFYRLVFGLAVPFFISPWIEAVGVNWVFGMMAFFSILAFAVIVALMVKGHAIREHALGHMGATEEGTRMVEKSI